MTLFFRKIEGGSTPLLILHGVFGSSDNWLTISKQIASDRYTVYLIDQRNHGRSPHAETHDYPSMASDLRAFISEHQLVDPVILGHSMGGKTAMEYVTRWPDEVSKLIVVDIAPREYPVHHTRLLEGLAAIRLEELKSRQQADEQLAKYEPSVGVRQFLLKNLYKKEDGSFAWRLNLPVLARDMPLIGRAVTSARPLEVPALFLRGGLSDYITDADWPEIMKLFPQATLETIAHAGHWIQAEQPARFLEALNRFLEK